MKKQQIIKQYIKNNYMKILIKNIMNNDFIICNIYLKGTQNFLYDSKLISIFETIKKKHFYWFFKNPKILLYKKNIFLDDLMFFFNLSYIYILFVYLTNNFYFNINKSFFIIKSFISFYFNFYNIFLKLFKYLILFFILRFKF